MSRRRKPKFSEIFTAFYTTVLGTAAVLDAQYKDGRRKELDRKIEESRRNLARLRKPSRLARQEHVEPPKNMMRPHVPTTAVEALASICKMDDALTRHKESKLQFMRFLRTIHRTYDPQEKLGNRFVDYLGPNLDAIAAAVDKERRDDLLEHREPLTNTQFERYHNMINRLVDALIIQSYYDETPWSHEAARRNIESLDSAWTAIRMLRSEGYPRYNHPGIDLAATTKARNELSDTIETLFEKWDSDKKKTKPKFQIAKICYNMLVCPVPPSIYHYNALIIGFSRRKMYKFVDIVAESLLEDSRLRPTMQTIVCLLNHYRLKQDIHGFYNMIRRMMAIDNRGLLVRRRWYKDVLRIPALHEWARQEAVTTSLKSNWVIERPSRTIDIYEALVSGLLSFVRVKDAAKVFIASLQEKVGTSVDLFIYLLRQCLYTLDAPAADILLRGFIDNADAIVLLILRADAPQRLAEHLYPLLNMGKPPSWPFSEERATVAWSSRSMILPKDDNNIKRLTRAMFIRHTETQLQQMDWIWQRIKNIMHEDDPKKRTQFALSGIGRLNKFIQQHEYMAGRLLKHQVLLKTARSVEDRTWDMVPGNMRTVHGHIVRVLGSHMPRPETTSGYENKTHVKEFREVADHWLRYRVKRMKGIRSRAQHLMLEIEIALLNGQRLQDDFFDRLSSGVTWRQLALDHPEGQDAFDGAHKNGENEPDDGNLWPKAEAGAVLTGVVLRVD